ncbi:MAG: hypothetical protein ACXVP5_04990 [Tumebacillaceae bacterium]
MSVLLIGLLLIGMTILSSYQVRGFFTQGLKKESVVYLFLMGGAALIGSLLLADVTIPSPSVPLKTIFEPIGHLIFHIE